MNQDDFRRMLASGGGGGGSDKRVSRGREAGFGGKRNITELDADGIRKLSAKKSSKKKGSKPSKQNDGDDDLDEGGGKKFSGNSSQYRDRAAERRQGGVNDMVDADEYKHLDADQSKFLGGDLAHTHLVKGLDFALLAQLKREKLALELATKVEKLKVHKIPGFSVGLGQQSGAAVTVATTVAPQKEEDTDELVEKQEPTFQTRLGRMVYFHACQAHPLSKKKTKAIKSELFLPGRMFYTFKVQAAGKDDAKPIAVQRSKEDCPDADDVVSGRIFDHLLIDDVRRAMEQRKLGKKMRRKRAEDTTAAMPTSDAEDNGMLAEENKHGSSGNDEEAKDEEEEEEEDIFPDVGEYVPAYLRVDGTIDDPVSSAEKATAVGYFSNLSASLTEAEQAAKRREQEVNDAWNATLKKAAAAQIQLEKDTQLEARAAKLADAQQDEYSVYQANGAGGYGSEDDDEGTGTTGTGTTTGTGKKRRKGGDAKASAAAPDGDEVDGDEKDRRKKQKQGNKMENDLKKINKLLESKS